MSTKKFVFHTFQTLHQKQLCSLTYLKDKTKKKLEEEKNIFLLYNKDQKQICPFLENKKYKIFNKF